MTTKQALRILREAGELVTERPSRPMLRLIRDHTFDPLIKKACDKLLLVLVN